MIIEPEEFYDEEKHDVAKEDVRVEYGKKLNLEFQINEIKKLSDSVKGGIKCEHCGIDLMNAAITATKLAEFDGLNNQLSQCVSTLTELTNKETSFVNLKKAFDEYEKAKLLKAKIDANIESLELKLEAQRNTQTKFMEQQSKIEENKKLEETLIKASSRLNELANEKSLLEREQGANNSNIETLRKRIEKNNETI